MRPLVNWEMVPVPDESAPLEPSRADFLNRPVGQSPDVFGRIPENRLDPEIPEIVQ